MGSYKFFTNDKCEFYPCHKENVDKFNCIFCYCPLYFLGKECGGDFIYTDSGIKDCSNCVIPHKHENYDYIIKKLLEHTNKQNKR